MRDLHRFVATFGVCAVVALVTLSGTTAQATNHKSFRPASDTQLSQQIRDHNLQAAGCRE